MNGKMITLYGVNNIGKSTQAKELVGNLKSHGHDAVYVKYPVYDLEPTGPWLNRILRGGEEQKITEDQLQMLFTMNRYQFEPQLKEWLREGKIVVAEDYTGTGLAWGSTKGASLEWLINLNKYLVKEDLAIFLKGKRFLHAKENNHIHESKDELVESCNFVLQQLADKFGWIQVPVKSIISDTAADVWNEVHKFLKK